MFLHAVCLVVAVAVASAAPPIEDFTRAMHLKMLPRGDNNSSNSLTIRCSVKVDKTFFEQLIKLELSYSKTGNLDSFKHLACLNETSVKQDLATTEISARGKYLSNDLWSKIDVTWQNETAGYHTFYRCLASGIQPGKDKVMNIYRIIQVDGPNDSCVPGS